MKSSTAALLIVGFFAVAIAGKGADIANAPILDAPRVQQFLGMLAGAIACVCWFNPAMNKLPIRTHGVIVFLIAAATAIFAAIRGEF